MTVTDMDRLARDVAEAMVKAENAIGGYPRTSIAYSLQAMNGILLGLLNTQQQLLAAQRQTFYGTGGNS